MNYKTRMTTKNEVIFLVDLFQNGAYSSDIDDKLKVKSYVS